MQKQIKNSLALLFGFIALLAVIAMLTNAFPFLQEANPVFFATAAVFFIASIFLWLVPWVMLIKNSQASFSQMFFLGFCCVFASLTPVQIGADALRSIKMKELAKVAYSESISASMIVKGIKFLLIALVASFAFFSSLFNPALSSWVKIAMLSGFSVVAIAALLFLLPLRKLFGLKISMAFMSLAKFFKPFERLANYFQNYAFYLQAFSLKKLAVISLFAFLSLGFEFLALLFSFFAASLAIPFFVALTLFSILAILERTPFLPRGIGAVELAGFVFLSSHSFTQVQLDPGQIAAVIIIFDCVRLVIPTIASLAAYGFLSAVIKPKPVQPV